MKLTSAIGYWSLSWVAAGWGRWWWRWWGGWWCWESTSPARASEATETISSPRTAETNNFRGNIWEITFTEDLEPIWRYNSGWNKLVLIFYLQVGDWQVLSTRSRSQWVCQQEPWYREISRTCRPGCRLAPPPASPGRGWTILVGRRLTSSSIIIGIFLSLPRVRTRKKEAIALVPIVRLIQ